MFALAIITLLLLFIIYYRTPETGVVRPVSWPPGQSKLSEMPVPAADGTMPGRSWSTHVNFKRYYLYVPQVMLAMVGLDTNSGGNTGSNLRYKISAKNVTRTGFDLVIETWANTLLYTSDVQYIVV